MFLGAGPAFAQAGAEPTGGETASGDAVAEVVVTGTRVSRVGYDAPTPTTVLGAELVERMAPVNAMDALARLPAMRSNATGQTNQAVTGGSVGQSFVNLRGLGANRTLVLFDSQRLVPTTGTGAVDISVMPTTLLANIEVVTGGASAAYGSDALAGVVNFGLNTNMTGLKGSVLGRITSRGDGEAGQVAVAYGTRLLDDRLHVLASAEYFRTEGIKPRSRPWMQHPSMDVIGNPAFTPGSGLPSALLLPYIYVGIADGGSILSGPLAGTSFGPGGVPYQTPTSACSLASGLFLHCPSGPGDLLTNSTLFVYAESPQTRENYLLRAAYNLSENWQVSALGMYAASETKIQSTSLSTLISGALTIRNDNPFLAPTLAQRMADLGLTSFSMHGYYPQMDPTIMTRRNELTTGLLKINGNWDGWDIELFYNYGRAKGTSDIRNNWNRQKVFAAADAVVGPNGTIVCRAALSDPTTACRPLNPFGPNSFSDAALGYVLGTTHAVQTTEQHVVGFSVNGEPFSTWAGPVSLAFGAEYRDNSIEQTVDAVAAVGGWGLLNPRPYSGEDSNYEAFVESVVPLAKDASWAEKLDLNLAVRFTDYASAGAVVTWKAGLTWQPVDDVVLRFTRSRDIRAPSLQELYVASVGSTTSLIDRTTNTAVAGVQGFTLGNPDLDYEAADTITLGLVYSPSWLKGLRFSVDYYNIKVNDPIGTLSYQQISDRCLTTDPELCSLVARDPVAGTITSVRAPYLNLGSLEVRGVDFDATYRIDLDDYFGSDIGALELRLIASYLDTFKVSDGINTIDFAGSLSPAPPSSSGNFSGGTKWQWTLAGTYTWHAFSTTLEFIYWDGGAYDKSRPPGDLQFNRVDSSYNVNAAFEYKVSESVDIFFNVDNVTDKAPPPQIYYMGGNYDRAGRSFKLGVRFDLK